MLAVYHDGLRIVAAAGMIMALFFAAGAKNILIFFGLNDGPALETAATAFPIVCQKDVVTTFTPARATLNAYIRNAVAAGFCNTDRKSVV